jgi:peptidoglycan/LPS O-acetylase OafA/YrhL
LIHRDIPRRRRFWSAAVLCRFPQNRLTLRLPELSESQQTVLPWWGERWHVPAFIMFLLCWGIDAQAHIRGILAPTWSYELAIIAALITSLVTLGRQLPLQNVVLISGVFGLVALWAASAAGPLNWRSTLAWIAILLNVRGAAQYLMRSRRCARHYGWEFAAASGAIAAVAVSILYKSALPALTALFVTAGLLIATLPLFVNKRPVEPPVSWQPIVVLPLLLLWAYLPRI